VSIYTQYLEYIFKQYSTCQ